MRRLFGRQAALFYRAFWFLYAIEVKHRSVISHGFVVGTLLRLVYLTLGAIVCSSPFLLLSGVNVRDLVSSIDIQTIPIQAYYFLGGVLICDIVHSILDLTVKGGS